ncbi:amidohydrolase [Planctellipticum variicoloris]|uniref:amidohydrolase n=1 Tax=Planctellipticum variicoloris TaxID=3064265 RepID=UPI003013350C|nr:amidohydrolase [Planctomycetaceae bacterium SH412]
MLRSVRCRLVPGLVILGSLTALRAADPAPLRPTQRTAMEDVDRRTDELRLVNKALWEFAEVGLEEKKSSALLVEKLREAGFDVRVGVAGMPTAFVASYGFGKPVIGLLAEYDALPDLSQKVQPTQEPVEEGRPGHGCGHSGLGTGALGAALAMKAAMQQHNLKGTLRLFGTPAEETTIGKVYMLLDGAFEDLDACLHWHPAAKNEVWYGSTKALISAKFTFTGVAAHASGNPESGRSALDGVELMNLGVNFMREHVKSDARMHYVITDGGGAPNVVPPHATVWYYVRADDHRDVERYYEWVTEIARGAAMMSRTKLQIAIDTDCHELIPNTPLSEAIQNNLERVPRPQFTAAEQEFARRIQETLAQSPAGFNVGFDDRVHPLNPGTELGKGSTDVGDISWFIPTGGLRAACFAAGSPGHCWQNVAAIGSTAGDKGIHYAARVLAATGLDLLEDPELLAAARADFQRRMKDRKYTTLIPKGQKVPSRIR